MVMPGDIKERDHDNFDQDTTDGRSNRRVIIKNSGPSQAIPVVLTDGSINIGTVNAEIETQLSHRDNIPDLGDVADSTRIGDGVEELQINSDGEALVHDLDTHTRIGNINETAPLTDIASSGLNGRLQRLAQHLTTIITNLFTLISNLNKTPQSFTAAGFSYVSSVAPVNVGTAEAAFMLFRNPLGSTKVSRIFQYTVQADPAKSGVLFRFYSAPTVTATGTALTRTNLRIAASPVASQATPFSIPTTSSFGTYMSSYWLAAGEGSQQLPREMLVMLEANQDILITTQAGANNTLTGVSVFWGEE